LVFLLMNILPFYMEYLPGSASRALRGVIGKTETLKDIGYATYSKLCQTCVCPVLYYSARVWGAIRCLKNEHVHSRAVCYFLGVHKFAPVLAITGDMGWEPCEVRWKACMVRLWNRLWDMTTTRIASKVFQWDLSIAWATEMSDLFQQSNCEHLYEKPN
jgi:hypothetical protein